MFRTRFSPITARPTNPMSAVFAVGAMVAVLKKSSICRESHDSGAIVTAWASRFDGRVLDRLRGWSSPLHAFPRQLFGQNLHEPFKLRVHVLAGVISREET